MVNVFNDYFKEFADFLYVLAGSSVQPEERMTLTYSFDDYKPSVGQQKQFIDMLVKEGVFEITYKIPLPPIAKLFLTTNGNSKYSASGCLGYELLFDKKAFLKYRNNNPMIETLSDENELLAPYLSENGETLTLWTGEIKLRKRNNKTHSYVLANMIFKNEGDYSCKIDDYLKAYFETEVVGKHRAKITSILNNFNKEVGHELLLKQGNGLIYYDGPGSNNKEQLYNLL